jgi:uncharacterized membrane protein YedE/YeeE
MQIAALTICCFVLAWLFAYLDSRDKLLQIVLDGRIIGWMLVAAIVLFFLHAILNLAFGD